MVLVSELAIAVVVQSTHDDAATRAAGRGGGKSVSKDHSVSRDGIDGWRDGDGVAIATERWAFVVGDDEEHIPFSSLERADGREKCQDQQRGG